MAAISVQEGGGGDYTTLEAAVENGSTIDGDVITISGTWTSAENTNIAVADALTIQCTGAAKHIGRPHNGSETTYRHRNSSGHSFTITDTGSVTFICIDIQNTSTGTSDEVFRNNVSNTFLARDCVLGFASRNDQQDIYYNEQTVDATFENCHFYNAFRAVVDLSGPDAGSSVKINSCTSFDIGFSTGSTSRSGIVGSTASSATLTIDIYNCVFHMNTGTVLRHQINGNVTSTTERVITNAANINSDSSTNDVLNATISDVDSAGNYILLDTTTSPYDLRLLDSANNAAQDNHSSATGAGLTIPAVDIVGTSRPQNTDFDVGAFEVVAAGGGVTVDLTGQAVTSSQGVLTITGAAAVSLAGQSFTASQGTVTVSAGGAVTVSLVGQASTFSQGTLTATGQANVSLSGQSSTLGQGLVSVTAGGAVSVNLSGQEITINQGSLTPTGQALVTLTGLSSTSAQGSVTVTISTTPTVVNLTGQEITAQNGILSLQTANVISLSGLGITTIQGIVTVVGDLPNVPEAKGINSSGAFGNGIKFTATFGSGIGSKGSL